MAQKQDVHPGESIVGPHAPAEDHGADHGHDDHAHGGGDVLGPLDIQSWGAALLGIALGLAVVLALVLAAG